MKVKLSDIKRMKKILDEAAVPMPDYVILDNEMIKMSDMTEEQRSRLEDFTNTVSGHNKPDEVR